MEEVWKDVEGYEGLYKISNKGRLRSLKPSRIKNGGKRIVKPYYRDGKPTVTIYNKNMERHEMRIANMVARAFLPKQIGMHSVAHKDGNPLNNAADNLEWTFPPIEQKKQVICLDTNEVFESVREAARQMHCGDSTIWNCVSGHAAHGMALGLRWAYYNEDKEDKK